MVMCVVHLRTDMRGCCLFPYLASVFAGGNRENYAKRSVIVVGNAGRDMKRKKPLKAPSPRRLVGQDYKVLHDTGKSLSQLVAAEHMSK